MALALSWECQIINVFAKVKRTKQIRGVEEHPKGFETFYFAGEHVELAKRFNALIFAVEHRFYGASINKDGLGLEQMQYLSSQQA